MIKIEDAWPPHKPAASGRVFTDRGMTYYVGVYHLQWKVLYSENEDTPTLQTFESSMRGMPLPEEE